MENYQAMITAIIDACDEIIDAMGADGAPLWPAKKYAAVLRVKYMAVHFDIDSGARKIYEQSLQMITDAKALADSQKHDKNAARTGRAMQTQYNKLLMSICDLNVTADHDRYTP